jgi:hypothetical protein
MSGSTTPAHEDDGTDGQILHGEVIPPDVPLPDELTDAELEAVAGGGNAATVTGAVANNTVMVTQVNVARASNSLRIHH